ncbi:hypothetical protein D3C76_1193980 [compost metagenome]
MQAVLCCVSQSNGVVQMIKRFQDNHRREDFLLPNRTAMSHMLEHGRRITSSLALVPTQKDSTFGQCFIDQLLGTTRRLLGNHRAYVRCSLVRITYYQGARLTDKTLTEVLIN